MNIGKEESTELFLSNAPHIKEDQPLKKIMWLVVLALIPANIYAVYLYGIDTLILLIVSILSAVSAEAGFQFFIGKPITITDGSAFITGLLLAMNVPPDAPVWMVAVGSIFAIVIAKQLFGGLGFNIFNPALAARAFMLASWPVQMTTKWHYFSSTNILAKEIKNISQVPKEAFDAITQATPLMALKDVSTICKDINIPHDSIYNLLLSNEMFKKLVIGDIGGCLGETSAILILLGGIFLLYKRIITWHIPVSYIGTVAVSMLLYYTHIDFPYPFKITLFHLLSGGLMLGAFFMATDMVTSPVTAKGMIIFGIGCGIIASVIRLWGGYPEGVSYSILLMNSAVPLIDRFTKPRVFGTLKKD